MSPIRPGDVLLVRVPYTDLSDAKTRPVVVVSPTSFNSRFENLIVLSLSSRDPNAPELRMEDWRAAVLFKESWVRSIVMTVRMSIVERKLGSLSKRDMSRVVEAINSIIVRDQP